MKRKILIPIILSILVGFLIGKFVFNLYESNIIITPVFNRGEDIYFIQYGVYSTIESMKSSTFNLEYYLYSIENDKYHVYIGITSLEENANKLQGYFEDKGYSIYIKQISVSNNKFLDILKQYDGVLSKTNDKKSIDVISDKVISKYKELVIKDES